MKILGFRRTGEAKLIDWGTEESLLLRFLVNISLTNDKSKPGRLTHDDGFYGFHGHHHRISTARSRQTRFINISPT